MLKRISLFAFLILVITSCSNDVDMKSREIEEYVSAVMKDDKNIICFGSASVKGVIEKTNYKSEPLIEGLISVEIDKLNRVLDIDSPVHFLVEGPISNNGKAKRVVLFIKVKDADALEKDLTQERSFLVEESGDIRYTEDDEFVIGFRSDLAIAIIQQGEYDAKNLINKIFKKSQGELSGGKIDEMLKAKGDLTLNVSMENLFGTSKTDLSKLSIQKQKEIKNMVKGSYIQSILNFEKGAMTFEAKNYFSKELKDLMFFKEKNNSILPQSLAMGYGSIIGGMSMNLDVDKMEKFYAAYAPTAFEKMDAQLDNMGGIMKVISSGNIMSSLSNGQFAALAIGNVENGELKVGMRSFIGAKEAGQKVFALARGEMNLPENGEFNYVTGGIEALIPMEGAPLSMLKGNNKLNMPKGSEKFGKKGFFAFINFDQIPKGGVGKAQQQVIDMFDYATLEIDNDGAKFYLKTKNSKDNILKQAMKVMMNMLPMLMSGGGMPF